MEDELNRPSQPDSAKEPGLIRALWVFFSSMKTAITLLLLLAIGSVIGTIIPQGGPPEMYIQKYGQGNGSSSAHSVSMTCSTPVGMCFC